jgi:hypothetical protein
MVLFLMIPLALVAITIAIAPVLAMTIIECRSEARAKEARAMEVRPMDVQLVEARPVAVQSVEPRPLATEPTRMPWNIGGPQPVAVPVPTPAAVPAARRRPARVA